MRRLTLWVLGLLLSGGLVVPLVRAAPTEEAGTAPATPVSAGVTGAWSSDFGQVLLFHQPLTGSARVDVDGLWQQPPGIGACPPQRRQPGCLGLMEQASYDPATRVLEFAYYEDWVHLRGTARLMLSTDGAILRGTWTQPGASGTWTMQRQPLPR